MGRRAGVADVGAPPAPPAPGQLVDEGPMRRELLRQIAALDEELTLWLVRTRPWHCARTTPRRGPALLETAALEQIRDELLAAIAELARGTTRRR